MALVFAAGEIGDYVLQSDWQAQEKTKKKLAALVHACLYTACFLPLTLSPVALAVIGSSHFLIDHFRLARYVAYAKNFLAPRHSFYTAQTVEEKPDGTRSLVITREKKTWWHSWEDCKGTGYHKDNPPWMSVWLMIRADNAIHLVINLLAVGLIP